MSLARVDVDRISLLARLRLTDVEADRLATELSKIVDFFRQLDQVDTSAVSPMAHAFDLCDVLADDELQPSLDRELALANAPKRDPECFRVPAVLGE